MSKKERLNKIHGERGFRLRYFYDVMDEVDEYLLKNNKTILPESLYDVVVELNQILLKQNLIERTDFVDFVNRRCERLERLDKY
jgi:hypothetical protein